MFPLTLFVYIFTITIIICNSILINDQTSEIIQGIKIENFAFGILAIFVLFIFDIPALIIICLSNIKTKWKIILSLDWLLFTPIYMIIYYAKFNIIFEKSLLKINNSHGLKNIKINSLISFIVLIILVMSMIIELIIGAQYPNIQTQPYWVEQVYTGLNSIIFITIGIYIYNYMISVYMSMFFNKKNIKHIGKIPFAFSVVWMYANKTISKSVSIC